MALPRFLSLYTVYHVRGRSAAPVYVVSGRSAKCLAFSAWEMSRRDEHFIVGAIYESPADMV